MEKNTADLLFSKIKKLLNLDDFDYDIVFIKQLKKSNTLVPTNTNQTHVAITGKQMDVFPYLWNYNHLVEKDSSFKKKYVLKVPLLLSKNNLSYLNNEKIEEKDSYVSSFTYVNKSKREDGEQLELSYLKFDGEEFVEDFRRKIGIDDYLIIFKEKEKLNYLFLGIKNQDYISMGITDITTVGDVFFEMTVPAFSKYVTTIDMNNFSLVAEDDEENSYNEEPKDYKELFKGWLVGKLKDNPTRNYLRYLETNVSRDFKDLLNKEITVFQVSDIETIAEYYTIYKEDEKFKEKDTSYHRGISSALKKYKEFLIDLDAEEKIGTREKFILWMKQQGLSPKTINDYSSALVNGIPKAFYDIKKEKLSIFEITNTEEIEDIIKIINSEEDFRSRFEKIPQINSSLKKYLEFLSSWQPEKVLRSIVYHPHNRILYWAPGTGKSYLLREQIDENFLTTVISNDDKVITTSERVTFYDGYTYGQFVGMYKPVPQGTDINYEYIPGSFMRILVNALKYPEYNFCLVIEELNRAKADKIFGNVFQLLDREDDGKSTYHIAVSEDQKNYLSEELKEHEELLNSIFHTGLFIPNNFYIWATMNSADQGVYPLDSAFKRRWSFEHIGLNENENSFGDEGQKYYVKYSLANEEIEWNDFRRQINEELLKHNIPEDRLLAPFFIKSRDFTMKEARNILNEQVFLNKILVYLFDDVLRHKKKVILFSEECSSFSKLKDNFIKGKSIFGLNFENIPNEIENDTEEILSEEENV